jgi:hypothetical protein
MGFELGIESYGTQMYYDWVCRSEGYDWPEHQLDQVYKPDNEE